MKHRNIKFVIALLLLLILIVYAHDVPKKVTKEDEKYLKLYLNNVDMPSPKVVLSFNEQIALIKKVQEKILRISPNGKGVPKYIERSPKNLFENRQGLCYDRSFVVELALQYLGFETRHLAIFEDDPSILNWLELTQKGLKSHAATEVRTQKGWLIVEPNHKWLSIDSDDNPISLEKMKEQGYDKFKWGKEIPLSIYKRNFQFYYGLYSRHGKFFKPYNFIPDYNLKEFCYNFK